MPIKELDIRNIFDYQLQQDYDDGSNDLFFCIIGSMVLKHFY